MNSTRKLLGFVLLTLLLVGGLVGLLFSLRGDRSPSESLQPAASESPAREKAGIESLNFEDGSATRNSASAESPSPPRSPRRRVESEWEEEDLLWVRGKVTPRVGEGGCAGADRKLTVFALFESGDQVLLRERLFLESKAGAEGKPTPSSRAIFARREVEASGEFRIPFPPDLEIGHLIALGDFESMTQSEPIRLRLERTALLATRCGGCIRGRVNSEFLEAGTNRFGTDEDFVDLDVDPLLPPSPATRVEYAGQKVRIAPDGRFLLRAVPPGSDLQLDVHSSFLAMTRIDVPPLEAGEERDLDVTLLPGGTLSGRVVDLEGTPIPEVTVEARLGGDFLGFDRQKARQTETDTDGRFTLNAVAAGTVTLVAEKEGWLEVSSPAPLPEASEGEASEGETKARPTEFTLQAGDEIKDIVLVLDPGDSIEGLVRLDDGSPVKGATVRVSFDRAALSDRTALNAAYGGSGRTVTDEAGHFRVRGLGRGPFTVAASIADPVDDGSSAEPPGKDAEDFGPSGLAERLRLHWKARLDAVPPGSTDLELTLQPPSVLRGRVEQEAGEPVVEFAVHAQRIAEGALGALGQPQLRTPFQTEDGTFELLGLGPGTWKLSIDAAEFALPDTQIVRIPRAEAGDELLFRLTRGATVSGFVRNPIGLSCPEAEVRTESSRNTAMNEIEGLPRELVARTGADGSFRLDGLQPGSIALQAEALGYAASLPVELDLAPGEHRRSVEFVLRTGGSIEGSVFEDDGSAAAHRVVSLYHNKFKDTQTHRSDEEGRFRIDHLEPGTWQISCILSDVDLAGAARRGDTEETLAAQGELFVALRMTSAEVLDGQTTQVVLGTPPGRRVRVFGQVTQGGEAFSPATITFAPEGEGFLEGVKLAPVTKGGQYETLLPRAGRYAISVEQSKGVAGDQNSLEYFAEIPDQEEFRYDLEIPTGQISGRITRADGTPASQTRVTLDVEGAIDSGSFMGSHFYERQANANGEYSVTGLRPGSYRIAVGGMPLGGLISDSAVHGRLARSGITLSEGEHRENVDFVMNEESPGGVEVLVLDGNSNPVGDAAVFARREDGTLVDSLSWALTGQDGRATYSGLDPGRYTISARSERLASPLSGTQVDVRAGKTLRIEQRVTDATRLFVTTADASGEKTRASYVVENADGIQVQRMQSLDELRRAVAGGGFALLEANFGPLPPGRYRVTATGPDGRTVTKPVKLSGQEERRMTLRLR